jgi:NADH-quinone oxidoreductase subunit H
MGISLIALLMVTGTLSLKEMVLQQQTGYWNIVYQPLGFVLFLICAFAECNRTPFDLPEAENELIGGYHTEYSSMKLGFYLFSEYINMFVSSVIMATLFFGGYDIPFLNEANYNQNVMAACGVAALMIKVVCFIFLFMWVRWTIPRFRYDQLMNLGWRILIPLALFNMLVTGALILLKQNNWHF